MVWIIISLLFVCILCLLHMVISLRIRVNHHKEMFDDVWRELLRERNRM